MADLAEVAALLHVHKGLHEHGEAFPHLKKAVLEKLRDIEADHAPKKVEPEAPAEEAPAEEEAPADESPAEEETEDGE